MSEGDVLGMFAEGVTSDNFFVFHEGQAGQYISLEHM
jgi:hypothetical protein